MTRGIVLRVVYDEHALFLADALEGAGRMAEARKQWQTVLAMEPCYPSYAEPMATARGKLARR